jgi:hypothetical protein
MAISIMTEGIEGLTGGGIKCDNHECDYEDMSVKSEDWPDYVNKPCPKCGDNLFTEEDFARTEMLFKIIKMILDMPENAQREMMISMGIDPDDPAMQEMVNTTINTHNGITFKINKGLQDE